MNTLIDWLGKIPTTNARIIVTLLLALGTAIRYWVSGHMMLTGPTAGQWVQGWEPSWEWLAFLVTMSGLDAAQFLSKRATDATYVNAKAGAARSARASGAATPPASSIP